MLNREPIFVNGFSRGGTTMLTNLLASHPDVCLIGETHHVFKGHSITDSLWRVINKCLSRDAPIMVGLGQDFFSPRLITPRKTLGSWAERLIDRTLFREKLRSNHPLLNRYKSSEAEYTWQEIAQSRLLCKNIDGMIYGNDAFVDMYPDGTFLGLVRNGLAVCEGHIRRGRSAEEIGWRYQILVDKMLMDSERISSYRIIRFEDLIAQPMNSLHSVYAHAGLDVSRLSEIRMQVRRVMDADGNHRLNGKSEWDVVWLQPRDLANYFQSDVDGNQIRHLSQADRDKFLMKAGPAMERLGYPTGSFGEEEDAPHCIKFEPVVKQDQGPEVNPARRAA
jgi:hypothetical protein